MKKWSFLDEGKGPVRNIVIVKFTIYMNFFFLSKFELELVVNLQSCIHTGIHCSCLVNADGIPMEARPEDKNGAILTGGNEILLHHKKQ